MLKEAKPLALVRYMRTYRLMLERQDGAAVRSEKALDDPTFGLDCGEARDAVVDCFFKEGPWPTEEGKRAVHLAQEAEERIDVHMYGSGAVSEVNPEFGGNRDEDDGKNREVNTFGELMAEEVDEAVACLLFQ